MADDVQWAMIESLSLRGRDGEDLRLGRGPGASEAQIAGFVAQFGLPLTGTYLDFLRRSNGADLFGVTVSGTEPATSDGDRAGLVKRRLVPFHDWGNGDFDCLDLTKAVGGEPPVAFWTEETGDLFPITAGFGRWTRMAVFEIQTHGFLLHPREYLDPRYANAQGVYESIANVRKAFLGPGDPGSAEPVGAAPPPRVRRRDRLLGWLRG